MVKNDIKSLIRHTGIVAGFRDHVDMGVVNLENQVPDLGITANPGDNGNNHFTKNSEIFRRLPTYIRRDWLNLQTASYTDNVERKCRPNLSRCDQIGRF